MASSPLLEYFYKGLKPDSIISVSDWADANRVLSQTASSEPGRFRTSRTPYLREIMDALSPSSPYEKVVFMKGAQIGGTEAGNNWIGWNRLANLDIHCPITDTSFQNPCS